MKYRRRAEIVDAVQWWKVGDHPAVVCYGGGRWICRQCGRVNMDHGLVKMVNEPICPGDWVVKARNRGLFIMKPAEFEAEYEKV